MKHKRRDQIPLTLLQLQNFIKRDPPSYEYEFQLRYEHFKSLLQAFQIKPQTYDEELNELIYFLAHVSHCYKNHLANFPIEIMTLLHQYATVLDPTIRLGFCRSLVLMRNKNMIDGIELLSLFFELLRCQDRILRKYLQVYIVSDIKNVNAQHKNMKLNTVLQNFMYKMLQDSNKKAVKMSLDVMIELYRKQVWTNAKTINVIATACFSNYNKVLVTSLKFFLGTDKEDDNESSSESENEGPSLNEIMHTAKVNKKSRSRKKVLEKAKQCLKKSKKKSKKAPNEFSALHLLHDPQGMAEKLLKKLESMNERYEIKLLVMNLISRLIGVHKLTLLNFYSLLQRYLQPHQRDVTQFLVFAAQSAHELVPPDVMYPLIKCIANNFISERNSAEVMTVGLNSVREICMRCPFGIQEELLQDLTEYKSYKNKNVSMAARSLISLFRRINPKLLVRKDRGKPTEAMKELKPLDFGELDAKSFIPGAEVLPEIPEENEEDIDETSDEDSDDYEVDDEDIDNKNEEAETKEHAEKNNAPNTSESKPDVVQKQEKAMEISTNRILSQEEFRKIRIAQLSKQVQVTKGKKRKTTEDEEEEMEKKEIVSLSDIERLHKKLKQDKESRLSTVNEGRQGRESYAKKRKPKNENCSTTQKKKNKNKAFMMIKHKVKAKTKRSFRDKQIALRNSLLKGKRKY